MRRDVDEPVVRIEQQRFGRAAFIADQRVERVDQLELRLGTAPAAAAQRMLLHFGLRDPLERASLQHAALALHLALDRHRHDSEAQPAVEPIGRHFLAGRELRREPGTRPERSFRRDSP